MCRRYVFVLLTAFALLAMGLVACNPGESDATRAMRSNAEGTIGAMGNRMKTMEATNAAVGTITSQLEITVGLLDEEKNLNKELTARLNQNVSPVGPGQTQPQATTVPPLPGGDPGVAPIVQPTANNQVVATSANPTAFAIERITTARGVDSANGCAVNETTSFNTTDARIWVIAYVRNLKSGIAFKSTWQLGGEAKEFTYTSNFNSARTCINFYIEPRTLNIEPGDYNVSIAAGTDISGGASFKVVGPAQPAATASVP